MYVGGVPPEPPPLPSRYRTKQGRLVSCGRRLKKVEQKQWLLQQHLLSQPRLQHPETPHQDQLVTPREQFVTLQQDPPLTPREQFAKYYGFALPPPLPQQEDPDAGYPYECGGGFIMTNDLCSRPPPPARFRRSSSSRASSSALTYPSNLNHDDLLTIFNEQLVHSKTQSSTPTPRTQQISTKCERPILPQGAEGKLLVPDVKLKARCQCLSGASIESAPYTSSSRKPSKIQDSNKQGQGVLTLLTLGQPSFKSTYFYLLYLLSQLIYHSARPWSYDGMQTYPVLKLPPKKQIRILIKIVDGEEVEVETEVEVHEKPKKLFLFAPKVVPMH
jgi:hypothetical protein